MWVRACCDVAILEVFINGRWQIYDPDLAVYYLMPDGAVAGLDDLTTNPSLISSPSAPIFRGSSYDFPYSQIVTTIYATTGDNFLGDSTFIARTPATYQPLVLPAGAQFAYPGWWTSTVTGIDGAVPYEYSTFSAGKS